MDNHEILNCTKFQSDDSNSEKIRFTSRFKFVAEKRSPILGQTDCDRQLHIVRTMRQNLICVISVKDMSKKEKEVYKQ